MSTSIKAGALLSLVLFAGAAWATDSSQQPSKEGHQPPAPPQEALAACSGKAANDSCSFSMPDGKTMSGTCSAMPGNSELSCGPKGGMGHPPKDGQPPKDAPSEE